MSYVPKNWVNDAPPAIDAAAMLKIEEGIEWSHDAIGGLTSPMDAVAHVCQTFDNNEEAHQFNTIQGAIDFLYSTYGAVYGATVYVAPGTYTEQIHGYNGTFIRGLNLTTPVYEEQPDETKPATLYNTGADEAHYPLRSNDGDCFNIQNMNIKTDADMVFGKISKSRFNNCRFEGGYFIEGTEDIRVFSMWHECAFKECDGFKLTGVAPNGRYLVFERCWFGWHKTMRFESTHTTSNAVIDIDGGHLAFTYMSVKGDWYHFAKNYHSFGANRHVYDTTKGIVYREVTITNGIHFISDPMSFKMVSCGMEDGAEMPIPVGEADITADVPITDVVFQNNAMHNGLCGNVRIIGFFKNVGGHAIDKYINLPEAIKSIPPSGSSTIDIYEDQTDLAELIPNAETDIAIRCGKKYDLTFLGNIVTLGLNQKMSFQSVAYLDGVKAEIDGDGAFLGFEGCLTVQAEIVCTSGVGSMLITYFSSLLGHDALPVIQVDTTDTVIMFGYSRAKGAPGQPAILFNAEADGMLKAKFSTFYHGDGGVLKPIDYSGSGKVDVAIYHSGMNASLDAAKFHNLIGSAGIIIDPEINF